MSLWGSVVVKLKEIFSKMLGSRTIENELKIAPLISPQMENAIELWGKMYKNEAKWLHEPTEADPTRVVSLGLPSMIASEKARTALLEWKSEITDVIEGEEEATAQPTDNNTKLPQTPKDNTKEQEDANAEKDTDDNKDTKTPENTNVNASNNKDNETNDKNNVDKEKALNDAKQALDKLKKQEPKQPEKKKEEDNKPTRASFLNEQYEKFKDNIRVQLEYGIAKGGLVIKPYPVISKDGENSIEFDFVQADGFYPISFDSSKRITEAAFVQTKQQKNYTYRRLEYHKWENNTVTVINRAFKTTAANVVGLDNATDLGTEVPLTEIPEWSTLQPKTTIKGIDRPLFAYFRMPQANTIDTSSPLGVSGYSRAVGLIQDADEQYSRMLWEYEGGEMAIDIDRDALRTDTDANGRDVTRLPLHQQRLYRKVDLSQTGDTYNVFAPPLRDASYVNGLNSILTRIEDACAISRGTLSTPETEARTATELNILRKRTYEANNEIQTALEKAIKDVVYTMNAYCDLYKLAPDGDYDVSFEWDDSILNDKDTELTKRMQLKDAGVYSKLELRMWYFGETEEQAMEALAKVDDESMQAMQQNMLAQADMLQSDPRNEQFNEE